MNYLLNEVGEILGRYSFPEPGSIELPDPPTSEQNWKWSGSTWVRDLDGFKKNCCLAIDETLAGRLAAGFIFQDMKFQADPLAQSNATGFLTAVTAGLPVLPITWRTLDNVMVQFQAANDFAHFASAMMFAIQEVYVSIWTAKDEVRGADTVEEVESILDGYLKKYV